MVPFLLSGNRFRKYTTTYLNGRDISKGTKKSLDIFVNTYMWVNIKWLSEKKKPLKATVYDTIRDSFFHSLYTKNRKF